MEESTTVGRRSRTSSLVCNLEHSFLLSPEERELDNDLNTPHLTLKQPQHMRGGSLPPSVPPPAIEQGLDKIFKADFVPSLLKRSSSNCSSSPSRTPPSSDKISVDKKLIEKLLSRIDDLESKIENINGAKQHANRHSQVDESYSETVSNLSLATSATTMGTENVSMKYRVLSPPSSITGGLSSDEDESHTRRTSRTRGSSNSDKMIESLNSKIETNHEHLTRLDHVVTMQEEMIRRQQETLQNMLKNPALLAMAPLRITRFMRRVVRVNRWRKMQALKAKNHAAEAIGSVARGWLQRLRFSKIKGSTFKIQACVRSWKESKAFRKKKQATKSIQKIMRGASVRRPARLRHLFLSHVEKLKELKDAAERLERCEVLCPITKEAVVDSVVCLVDGFTYERAAIETWVQQNKTSPLTRDTVTLSDLVKPSDLIEELKATKQSYRENLKSVVELKMERDVLKRKNVTGSMKLSFVSNEMEELRTQHEVEVEEIQKLKSENLRLKQDIASIRAKNEGVESDNAELRKQLSRSTRRAKSVQHERDEFNLQLATEKIKAENLEKEVEEGKGVHQRLLSEFSRKWATQAYNKRSEGAAMLRAAISSRNSRSLLEESCWGETGSETQVQGDSSDEVVCCSGRSGLEEGTWEREGSDGNKCEEEAGSGAVSCGQRGTVGGTRGSLEDSTWSNESGQPVWPLRAHLTDESQLKISKVLLKAPTSNKILSFEKLKKIVSDNSCEENNIDRKTIEYSLSDKTFSKVFHVDKRAWADMPDWKRMEEKKKAGLFI
ncbi:hypothetical protein TrVE_jg493 [Triparma verrucosa]|uniref:HP domain-containing protein n=1 Tax=Triparma verrucosa TaxID=1606542 RepID=A0A9W7EUT2_9STRA|nr:hypothetical protein TrVE_jg493 [Triparma verrucosa]